jgi:hypothetical protein
MIGVRGKSMSDIATRNLAVGSEGFRVGRVLSKSLMILMGNFPKYILFGAIIALPNFISGAWTRSSRPPSSSAASSSLSSGSSFSAYPNRR